MRADRGTLQRDDVGPPLQTHRAEDRNRSDPDPNLSGSRHVAAASVALDDLAGCFAYLANSFTSLVLPAYATQVAHWMNPVQLVEMILMAWLLVMGATPKPSPA
jgi:hypothetical protein